MWDKGEVEAEAGVEVEGAEERDRYYVWMPASRKPREGQMTAQPLGDAGEKWDGEIPYAFSRERRSFAHGRLLSVNPVARTTRL